MQRTNTGPTRIQICTVQYSHLYSITHSTYIHNTVHTHSYIHPTLGQKLIASWIADIAIYFYQSTDKQSQEGSGVPIVTSCVWQRRHSQRARSEKQRHVDLPAILTPRRASLSSMLDRLDAALAITHHPPKSLSPISHPSVVELVATAGNGPNC